MCFLDSRNAPQTPRLPNWCCAAAVSSADVRRSRPTQTAIAFFTGDHRSKCLEYLFLVTPATHIFHCFLTILDKIQEETLPTYDDKFASYIRTSFSRLVYPRFLSTSLAVYCWATRMGRRLYARPQHLRPVTPWDQGGRATK